MKLKKIKGYLPLHLVRWIQAQAKVEGVKPSNVIKGIVSGTVHKPKKMRRDLLEWSADVPSIRMEMSFSADEQLLEAWEDFKELNGITCDCQTMKLILKERYGYSDKAEKSQRKLCFVD